MLDLKLKSFILSLSLAELRILDVLMSSTSNIVYRLGSSMTFRYNLS